MNKEQILDALEDYLRAQDPEALCDCDLFILDLLEACGRTIEEAA